MSMLSHRETSNKTTGNLGEDVACQFLEQKGWRRIDRNFRLTFGEIDLIMKDSTKTLVFVEVKTLIAGGPLKPEDNYSEAKSRKAKKIYQAYAANHPELIKEDRGWRADLLCVELSPDFDLSLTEQAENCVVRHYENT